MTTLKPSNHTSLLLLATPPLPSAGKRRGVSRPSIRPSIEQRHHSPLKHTHAWDVQSLNVSHMKMTTKPKGTMEM